jgi:drug/metabolite transporter (DMT)-like permease
MDYPFPVFLAVLGAAFLHAAWNALVRGGQDPLLHTAAIVMWTGIYALPLLFFLPLPSPESWPFMVGSIVVHIAYYFTLAGAYRNGALTVMYPIIRGCAPLLVSIGSIVFVGEALSTGGWLGVALISTGVLGIALRSGLTNPSVGLKWALACSATIATYSIIDGQGARTSGNALSFAMWLFVLESLVFFAILARIGRGRALVQYIGVRLKGTAAGGFMSAVGYTIVLWAMTQAPLAAVSATRETSVLFATILGVWFLKERLKPRQWISAIGILAGLVVLRM